MGIPHLITGNNLFRQWGCTERVLENFEHWSKTHSSISSGFNKKEANLVNICWSYNVFQNEDGYYITGAWGDNENIVTKLDNFEKPLNTSDLITSCNDYNIFIVDVNLLKVWILNVGETLEIYPINLSFEFSIERPQHLKISKIIASNETTTFLTNSGHVFSGIPPVYIDTSHCIGDVCDIVCGYDHFMLLTSVGHVYTWGSGLRFQLGHGDIVKVDFPTEVEALAGLKIIKIVAGGFHSLALSEFGDVYAWGWNDDGQLGLTLEKKSSDSVKVPRCSGLPAVVDIFDENGEEVELNVVDIACGSRHSVIKLEDNSVWAAGYNEYGQLGLPQQDYPFVNYFHKVLHCDFDFELMCGTWATAILKK